MTLYRNKITEKTSEDKLFSSDSSVDDIISYFNRQNDRSQIEASIKSLWGYGIKSEQDPANKDDVLETYSKEGFNVRVDNGLVQSISIGFGNKVISALATLFTEQGQKFTLTSDKTKDTSEVQSLLSEHRKKGGFKTSRVRADKLSIQVGSSCIVPTYANGHMHYRYTGPQNIRAFFGNTIVEDGAERAVDTTCIDEATCIVIRLASVDVDKWNYLAVYAAGIDYPKGRWVVYQAGNTIEVPNLGDQSILEEYMINGVQCNPLSYFAQENPDIETPEYPISIIYSGVTDSADLMPTSSSLYQSCIEASRSASHTLHKSQEAASSTIAIKVGPQAQGKPLPRSLNGAISLLPGQDIEQIDHDSDACKTAYGVLQDIMIDVAAGYSVPDYMIVSESMDRNINQSSGIALQIKSRQLKKFREFRIDENADSVDRIFKIERAFIMQFSDEDSSLLSLLGTCEQTWDAGELKMPENKKEAAERIISLMDKGVLDTIAAIREYYNLPSDDEAIEIYKQMKDRATEYPPLTQKEEPQPKQRPGLLRRQQIAG